MLMSPFYDKRKKRSLTTAFRLQS
uniref:Uncharacterized protein n=1 Tax=Anguilla anguilla TaxID=7936 RepID=A0A0E9TZF2_ANGAN